MGGRISRLNLYSYLKPLQIFLLTRGKWNVKLIPWLWQEVQVIGRCVSYWLMYSSHAHMFVASIPAMIDVMCSWRKIIISCCRGPLSLLSCVILHRAGVTSVDGYMAVQNAGNQTSETMKWKGHLNYFFILDSKSIALWVRYFHYNQAVQAPVKCVSSHRFKIQESLLSERYWDWKTKISSLA